MRKVISQWVNKPRRIASHLMTYAAVMAIPALLAGVCVGYQYTVSQTKEIYENSLRVAHSAAAIIDVELDTGLSTLDTLATTTEIMSGDFHGFYTKVKSLHLPEGSWIFVTDRDSNIVVNSRMNTEGPYGMTAVKDFNDQVFRSGKEIVSGILYGKNSNEWLTAIGYPVPHGGKEALYVVYYVFPAHHWLDVLTNMDLPDGWFLTLDDADGNVIARTMNHDKFVGKPSVKPIFDRIKTMQPGETGIWSNMVSLEGKPIIGAYHKIIGSGWVVVTSAGPSVYNKPLIRAVIVSTLAIALMALLTWFAAQSMSRRLTTAIGALETKSQALKAEKIISLPPTIVHEVNIAIATMREAAEMLVSRASSQNMMLRELNHRVKNSLQNVASLLRMQQRASSTEVREALNAASLRVTAIGRVHEGLYNVADMSVSSVYFERLLKDISQVMMVDFDTDLHNISLDIDQAVPLSLLINEAVVNAIKYGKSEDKSDYTPVYVYFGLDNPTQWRLVVRDYGRGFSSSFSEQRHLTIGIKLMKMMAVQSSAEITFTNHPDGGAVVTVTGPVRIAKVTD